MDQTETECTTKCLLRVIHSVNDVQAEVLLNGDVIRKRKRKKRLMKIIDSDDKSLSNCNRATVNTATE